MDIARKKKSPPKDNVACAHLWNTIVNVIPIGLAHEGLSDVCNEIGAKGSPRVSAWGQWWLLGAPQRNIEIQMSWRNGIHRRGKIQEMFPKRFFEIGWCLKMLLTFISVKSTIQEKGGFSHFVSFSPLIFSSYLPLEESSQLICMLLSFLEWKCQ